MSDRLNSLPVFLLAFANDHGERSQYLRNLADELRQIRGALDEAKSQGLCDYVYLANATLKEILDTFTKNEYRNRIAVFHYGGHANSFQLMLETNDGRVATADAAGLAAFLGQQRGLQLVFLNGCSTQQQVEALLEANISMVIATSQAINDEVAKEFATRFYRGLAGGINVHAAYKEAEGAARAQGDGNVRNLFWAGAQPSIEKIQEERWPWDLYFKEGAATAGDWSLPRAADNPLFGLPELPHRDLPANPFRHLSWFAREHAEIFFGRGTQIRQLYERIIEAESAPIVLLYGQAGVGKSSLLDAGVRPRLEGSHELLYFRRNQSFGLLGTLQKGLTASSSLATAWHMREGLPGKPVVSTPGKPVVLILDQVEEIFTRPNANLPDELENFFTALTDTFSNLTTRPRGKLILAFRKEWEPEIEQKLDEYKLPYAKVFLQPLSRKDAIQAVVGVSNTPRLQQQYQLTIEDGLAEIIADDLMSDPDSPVAPTLQILLTKMWAEAKLRNNARPVFDRSLYQELKRQGTLLSDFLDQQLLKLKEDQPEVVDSGFALDVLAYHTTPLATTEQRTEAQTKQEYQQRLNVLPQLLDRLKELYLLADPPQDQQNVVIAKATRLAHDTLAPPLRARFDKSVFPGQRARRILENRNAEWQDNKEGAPLDERDLTAVEAGVNGMRHWSPDEERLIKASRDARSQRARKGRILRLVGATAIVLIIVFAGITWWQRGLAQQAERKAVARQLAAQANVLANGQNWLLTRRVLLAIEANRHFVSSESVDALRAGLDLLPRRKAHFAHEGAVLSAQFSPDGKLLATGSKDKTARVWNLADGKQVAYLKHDHSVNSVVFSDDGRYLISGSGEGKSDFSAIKDPAHGQIKIWDFQNQAEVLIGDFNSSIVNLVFMPGNAAVVVEMLNSVQVISLKDNHPTKIYEVNDLDNRQRAISPDGKYLAIQENLIVFVFDLPKKSQVASLGVSPNRVNPLSGGGFRDPAVRHAILENQAQRMEFNSTGKYLAVATADGQIHVGDWASAKEIGLIKKKNTRDRTVALAFSTDNKNIVEISSDQYLNVWDIDTGDNIFGTPTESVPQVGEDSPGLQFSPNAGDFVVTSGNLTSRLFHLFPQPKDSMSPRAKEILRMSPEAYISSHALSRDGKLLATGDDKGGIDTWELTNARDAVVIPGAAMISYSPSGRYIVSSQIDFGEGVTVNGANGVKLIPSVKVFEANTLKSRTECNIEGGSLFAVSPRDEFIAAANDSEGKVRVCEIATGKLSGPFDIGGEARVMTFSSTRPVLLVANDQRAVYEIDIQSGSVKVRSDMQSAMSTYFSSDGRYIAINRGKNVLPGGGMTGSVIEVLDAETGRKMMSVSSDQAYREPILSRDGKYLAAINDLAVSQREIVIWEATTGREIKRLPTSQPSGGMEFPNSLFTFGYDSQSIAVTEGTRVKICDLRSNDVVPIDTLKKVMRVVLSQDSKYMLAVSDDHTAQIWNLSSHTPEGSIEVTLSRLYDVSFSPDARSIIFAGTNEYISDQRRSQESEAQGWVVLWQSQDLIDEACRRLTRNLTPNEWSQYLGGERYTKTCPNLP